MLQALWRASCRLCDRIAMFLEGASSAALVLTVATVTVVMVVLAYGLGVLVSPN